MSQRLAANNFRKGSKTYKDPEISKISRYEIELDPKLVGLPGSPTIVYRVEKIPRAKTNRKAEIVDPSNANNLTPIIEKIVQISRGK